jgi:hypothetical protein
MRKLIAILLLVVTFSVSGQDTRPNSPDFKNLRSPSFSYFVTDSSVWIYKGNTYGWTKLISDRKVRFLIDSIANYTPVSSGTTLEVQVQQPSHGFSIGNWIRYDGTNYMKAQANSAVNADALGVVKAVTDTSFVFQFGGIYEEGSWSLGVNYFLSVDTSGVATSGITYKPGDIRVFLGTGVPGGLLLEIDVGLEISLTNPIDTIIGNNIITISSTGGSYTIGADLKKLMSDQTATVNDSIPWIDNDNGGRKMALSTLKSLSATSPAGTDGQIQYNNSGSFAGFGSYSSSRLQPGVPVELHTTTSSTNAYLTFDNTTKQVFAGNGTAAIPANFKKRQDLSSASTITMNFLSGSKASFTLAHSATLTITNLPDGEDGIITVTQGSGTAYTLTIEGSTGYTTKKIYGANDAIDATLSKKTKIVYERVGSELHLSYVYEN